MPDNSTYSVETAPSPAGQSFTLNPNGTYNYVPPTGYIGDVTFTYRVCLPAPNTGVCDTANVNINLACGATGTSIVLILSSLTLSVEQDVKLNKATTAKIGNSLETFISR